MWLLIFIFIIVTLLLSWTLFGYFILIFFIGLFNKRKNPDFPEQMPFMSVVIPCYNEEERIAEKVKNMNELDYPKNLIEIYFIDGGSQDRTIEYLNKEIAGNSVIKLVNCPQKGKINQLNYILPKLKGDIVVNTDVDALLNSEALKWIAAEFAGNPDASVVGAFCYPDETLDIEHYYWSAQNKGRLLETDARSSSMVIAQCYAFKRELLKAFPEDVVADDIYIAFLANTLGGTVIYSRHAMAFETRTPKRYTEFLPHKFRKSNAFLRESLRFVYRLPEMSNYFKMSFLTRVAQQVILPWAFLSWMLIAGILLTLFRYDIVILDALFLAVLFIITSRLFSWMKLPDGKHKYSMMTVIQGYLLTNIIMLSTGISYPYYRQKSDYKRIGGVAETRK